MPGRTRVKTQSNERLQSAKGGGWERKCENVQVDFENSIQFIVCRAYRKDCEKGPQ